jgi:hypothetical protein
MKNNKMKGWEGLMGNVINIYKDSNYKKCEAIKKLGYEIVNCGKSYVLTSKKNKNLDQFMNVYFRTINEIILAFKKDLYAAGYRFA